MMQMSIHNAIRSYVHEHRNEMRDFLAELVRVPSDNPPGDCAAHAERTAELLEGMGFEVERHRVPEALCQDNGMISATNLVVRRHLGTGPTVALNAHGDVVPPGAGWSHDPYGAEVEDGTMYGRGAAVSKSDFATYAFALRALEALPHAPSGTVELHLTYDEEVGGAIGPGWLLREGIVAPDFCISAGFAHSVVTAHNGCLHLEIEVRGKSAHAAMPHTGHDALAATARVLNRLYEERDRLSTRRSGIAGIGSPTLTIGLIQGGINTNVVPDRVTIRVDRRMIPEEVSQTVERDLTAAIEEVLATCEGISVRCRRIMLAVPLKSLDGTPQLAEMVRAHARRVFNEDIPVVGTPLYTDARHYSEAGIPTVIYGAGPHSLLEANGHRADEKLVLADLYGATEVVACSVAELLQPRSS
jgi:acetylornithine deacetylase/succinyl-diaminopimelate desuccinylase-like protein